MLASTLSVNYKRNERKYYERSKLMIEMYELGARVEYIRFHLKEDIITGDALVKAYGVDGENRPIALLQDLKRVDEQGKPEVFNVPVKCVNPDEIFISAFNSLIVETKTLETEANTAIRKLTEEANVAIAELNNAVLGDAILFGTE